jgi:hypothetical protein
LFRQRPFLLYDTFTLPARNTTRAPRQSPHPVVLNQRLTSETANSSGMRQNHEPLEQRCANTAPLLLVRNGYRYVGGIWDLFQPEASHEAQRLCFLPLGVQRQGTKCDVIKSVGTR